MKILVLSRGIPSLKDPAWGNFEFEQANALKELGHEIIFAGIDLRTRLIVRKIGITKNKIDGIPCYNIFLPFPYALLPVRISIYLSWLSLLILYKKILREIGSPDIIYAHYQQNIAAAVILKKRYSIPLVGIEHWSKLLANKMPKRVKQQGLITYKEADRIISVSNSLHSVLLSNFNCPSTIINNMVDYDTFNKTINKEKAEFKFLAIGRLIHRKGYDVLLQAFKRANFEKSTTLSIVGDGPLKNEIEKMIFDLGLNGQVSLLGLKDKNEIATLLSNSNAFVLTSRSETFGVVYIEAMAAGIPVVATKCGGPEEFMNDEVGILIPIDDVEATTNALIFIKNNYNSYDPNKIKKYCKDNFSKEVIARKIEMVLKDVLKQKV
jgi:glycosyltransferase involved in cell wall biosynthesis